MKIFCYPYELLSLLFIITSIAPIICTDIDSTAPQKVWVYKENLGINSYRFGINVYKITIPSRVVERQLWPRGDSQNWTHLRKFPVATPFSHLENKGNAFLGTIVKKTFFKDFYMKVQKHFTLIKDRGHFSAIKLQALIPYKLK